MLYAQFFAGVSGLPAAPLRCAHAPARALTYAEWIAGYPSLTGNATLPNADPDGDTIPNLLEFALAGGDPTVITMGILPTAWLQGRNADGSYNAPYQVGGAPVGETAHMLLRYIPRPDVTGIRYVPQPNNYDIGSWGWGDSAVEVFTDGGYTWARTISDYKLKNRSFMRLRIEIIE